MLKSIAKVALTVDPIWRASCATWRPLGVSVLMYHRIPPDTEVFPGTAVDQFRQQMRWLRDCCDPIHPDQLQEAAAHPTRWKRPPVLVTFDDGYRDYHDLAYPILAELKITSIVFLATGAIDRQEMIWTDDVNWVVHKTSRPEVRLPWDATQIHHPTHRDARTALGLACKSFLKGIPNQQRLDWLERLYAELGVHPAHSGLERQMLSWDEVRAASEYTCWGGHTHNHPILSQLDAGPMEDEIRICRERILIETGRAPRYFAYPNGRAQDFNPTTQSLLAKHGFELGFSTIEGLHNGRGDRYAIRRQHTGAANLGEFAMRVLGR
jgi:peptidoglycan/xylan/chitin deacetylase (PgdA/CDA1 family)